MTTTILNKVNKNVSTKNAVKQIKVSIDEVFYFDFIYTKTNPTNLNPR